MQNSNRITATQPRLNNANQASALHSNSLHLPSSERFSAPKHPRPSRPEPSKQSYNQALGALGEAAAGQYLEHRGWSILARNWRSARGEIDLVATHSGIVAAVEVKTRRSHTFGHPSEAVTSQKMARLRRLLATWVDTHPLSRIQTLRVDIIAVTWPLSHNLAELEHAVETGAVRCGINPDGLDIDHFEGGNS